MRENSWACFNRDGKISKGNVFWRKEGEVENRKRSGGVLKSDMRWGNVIEENVGDRVKWKSRTMVANPK